MFTIVSFWTLNFMLTPKFSYSRCVVVCFVKCGVLYKEQCTVVQ